MAQEEVVLESGEVVVIDNGEPEIFGPENPRQGLMGGAEATISSRPTQNFLESSYAKLFGKEAPDVYQDSEGNRVQDVYTQEDGLTTMPETSGQAANRKTATGLGLAASFVPGLNATKVPAVANFLGRLPVYAKTALQTSGIGLAADKASQQSGDLEKTTLEQDLDRLTNESALGFAIPSVADIGLTSIAKTGGYLKKKLASVIQPGKPERVIPGSTYEGPKGYSPVEEVLGKPKEVIPGATYAEKPKEVIPGQTYNPTRGYRKVADVPGKEKQVIPGATYAETPRKVIPGQTYGSTTLPKEEISFLDTLTKSDIEKSLKYTRKMDDQGTLGYRLDEAVGNIDAKTNALRLPPKESLAALDAEQSKVIEKINEAVIAAEKANPKAATIDFTNAKRYLSTLPDGSPERQAAEDALTAKMDELTNNWDGSLTDLQLRKTSNDRIYRGIYTRDDLTTNEQVQGELAKAISSDMRAGLEKFVPKIKGLNKELSELYTVEPIAVRRAASGIKQGLDPVEEVIAGPLKNARGPYSTMPTIEDAKASYSDMPTIIPGKAPYTKIAPNPVLGPLKEAKGPYSTMPTVNEGRAAYSEMPKIIPGTPSFTKIAPNPAQGPVSSAQGAYSTMPKIEPAVSQKVIPGPWQGKLDTALKILEPLFGAGAGYALNGPVGAVGGATLGAMRGNMGGGANLIGQIAGAAGQSAAALQKAIPALVPLMTRTAPEGVVDSSLNGYLSPNEANAEEMPTKLPRKTELMTSDNMVRFVQGAMATPEKAPIAQGLVKKMVEASNVGDMDKVEKIHADMVKLFPEQFESGFGVNGKVFHPDDQAKIMDNLKKLKREGVIDNIQLAKQRNAFADPMDGRILPTQPKQFNPSQQPHTMVNGTRRYSY